MRVCRGTDRFIQGFPKRDDLPVDVLQILLGFHITLLIADEIQIVPDRLDLQIIVEISDP